MTSVDRSRYFLIGLGVLLMAALVVVVGLSLTAGERPARVLPVQAAPTPTLPTEAGMYERVDAAAEYAAMPKEPNRKRTRAVYYARRAYPGAPPVIPHAIDLGQPAGTDHIAHQSLQRCLLGLGIIVLHPLVQIRHALIRARDEAEKLHLGEVMAENSQAGFDAAVIQETNAIDSKIKH